MRGEREERKAGNEEAVEVHDGLIPLFI